jgi:hypothetical protein
MILFVKIVPKNLPLPWWERGEVGGSFDGIQISLFRFSSPALWAGYFILLDRYAVIA